MNPYVSIVGQKRIDIAAQEVDTYLEALSLGKDAEEQPVDRDEMAAWALVSSIEHLTAVLDVRLGEIRDRPNG